MGVELIHQAIADRSESSVLSLDGLCNIHKGPRGTSKTEGSNFVLCSALAEIGIQPLIAVTRQISIHADL